MSAARPIEQPDDLGAEVPFATLWTRFWFTPADPRPLAAVRVLAALLGLLLLWSYAGDLQAWFGPGGMLPVDAARSWRPRFGFSLFDLATTAPSLWMLFGMTVAAFTALLLGLASRPAAIASAVLWASLLHRGPMLAGPADDCLAAILWCLVVGPCGHDRSLDRWLAARVGRPAPAASPWTRVALGLLMSLASAITLAGVMAQLKGDTWWDGSAAWWLAMRSSRIIDLAPLYARSEYLMNFVTHAIVAFEIVFAGGLWCGPMRRTIARVALVAWPLIGAIAGEPLWGLAMGIFAVPFAELVPVPADRP